MYFSSVCTSVDLGTAPMTVSIFTPSLKNMTVGMLRMPYSVATPGLSSVFSFSCARAPPPSRHGRPGVAPRGRVGAPQQHAAGRQSAA